MNRMSKELNGSLNSDLVFVRAAQQIAQRAQEKVVIGADDMCEITLRLLKNKETTERYGKPPLSEDLEFNKKLPQVKNICNAGEEELLGCLVNPSE